MEEDRPRLMPEDVDLQKIINEHVTFFRSMAESCDITMTVNADPVHVNGDPKMLDRLISILMDNSVKYCPDHKNIDITCSNSGKKVRFEITNDTEDDIGREAIKHLFDRFYRTDSSHNSETGGHGIGLSIAKAITDAHRGSITAEKRKGNSITFIVTLPVS
jgi:signal transduction histidine kinase